MNNKRYYIALVAITVYFSCVQNQSTDSNTFHNWQLFIDDYWIAQSDKITTTLHQPKRHPNNPLIRGNVSWEQNPYCYGSVIYDNQKSIFKIWYMSINRDQPVADRSPILYATSADGIHWIRPKLGLFEFEGSNENNIVLTNYGFHSLYSPSVIKDCVDPNPTRLYKMIWWDFPLGNKDYQDMGMCVAFSADGIHWAKYSDNPVLFAKKCEQSISDVMSVMQDQCSGKYVAYTKGWADPWPAFRQIVRTESDDFIHWSEPKVVIRHKHNDQDPQSYGMTVTQIGKMYIGLLCSFKDPGDETINVQLTVSHDNQNWLRVANQETFIPNGPPGSWDDGMIFTAPLINHGDQSLIYYGGWDGPHNQKDRRSGIGLAVLRKNGFVSLDTGQELGIVTTHAMDKTQGPLLVNADAVSGSLVAELLDVDGNPIPGYTANDCIPMQGDGLEERIQWHDYSELPNSNKALRIRFLMTQTSLYGFSAGSNIVRFDE